MAIIQKIKSNFKRKISFFSSIDANFLKVQKFNPIFFISFLIAFSCLFFISSNLINKKNKENFNNLNEIAKSSEFLNFKDFLVSKINSPYEEINYVIKNNDTVEKILKKFKVKNDDIANIAVQLRKSKLNNIYSGRKLSLIIKKLEDGSIAVINLKYPINNTSSVEIQKYRNNFLVKENILQLYKKEVVVKNIIKNN